MEHITKLYVTAVIVPLALLAMGSVASAQSFVDPTNGAADTIGAGGQDWITTQGVPLVIKLLIAGFCVALLVKFARRARAAV